MGFKQRSGLCEARSDKDDPRKFFYKDPKRKWRGVVVNTAHDAAWKYVVWKIGLSLVLPVVVAGLAICQLPITNPALFWKSLGVLVVLHLLSAIGMVVYAFRMAAKEEKDENRY